MDRASPSSSEPPHGNDGVPASGGSSSAKARPATNAGASAASTPAELGLISPEFRSLDRALDRVLNHDVGHTLGGVLSGTTSRSTSVPAGQGLVGRAHSDTVRGTDLAARVFEASRRHLPSADTFILAASEADDSNTSVVLHINDVAPLRRIDRVSTVVSRRVRWARVALSAAAVLAVTVGSWLVWHPSNEVSNDGSNRSGNRLADGNGVGGPGSNGRASEGATSIAAESVNSAAELTLVALLDDGSGVGDSVGGHYRRWISEDALGGTDAARLAAPVLRTQGAAIDDLESELGAIFGLPDQSLGHLDG